jgi:hypothetical protein
LRRTLRERRKRRSEGAGGETYTDGEVEDDDGKDDGEDLLDVG